MADTLNISVQPDGVTPQPSLTHKSSRVVTGTAAAILALSMSVGGQEAEGATPTPMTTDTSTIVVAQATSQETDGKIYTAEVIQVDGSKKVITYYLDKRGIIIAPPVVDRKLVDGSEAPTNPIEARVAQKKILAKYDRGSQLMIASVGKDDILGAADKDLSAIIEFAERGKSISKEQVFNGFYSIYLLMIASGDGKGEKTISGLETIAKIQLKINASEINQMKQNARLKAINIWKSVTGAISVG